MIIGTMLNNTDLLAVYGDPGDLDDDDDDNDTPTVQY